jgi:adenosine deaminase
MMTWVARRLAMGALTAVLMLAATSTPAESRSDQKLNASFAQAARSQALLRMLLQALPKGADLHRHGEGAIYAEDFMSWAAAKEGCFVVEKRALAAGPCGEPASVPLRGLETRDIKLYNDAVDALSMGRHDLRVGDPAISGHERFFATFGRFSFAARGERARVIAANREQAAYDNTLYIELMAGPNISRDLRPVYAAEPWNEADMAGRLDRLGPVLAEAVAAGRADTDATETTANELNGCAASVMAARTNDPGFTRAVTSACDVTVRYLMTVGREAPPEQVFGRLALAFAMVEGDGRFVGVNIAQPEDGPVSLRDYGLHMRMFAFLKSRFPRVPLSLHAGELTLGLTPPRDLRFHIREAVEVAGARRIGHGVDIAYEDGAVPLLARMAREHIAVEINLTSNDVILGVKGAQHPLALYRAAGVPVVLATDDAGVSRGDLTQEYLRAMTEQGLLYTDLRQISRDSLTYSFLDGESLTPACANLREPSSPACREVLQRSAKAREQRRLEQAFARFEAELPGVLKAIPLRRQ